MNSKPLHRHLCPRCGVELWRVHRQPGDRLLSLVRSVHRYRCPEFACGWEGLAPSASASGSFAERLLAWRPMAARGLLAGTLLLLGLSLFRFAGTPAPAPQPLACNAAVALRFVPAGESYDGIELPIDGPASAAALDVRRGCAWGVPGRSPYRGTIAEALAAAGLPAEAIRQVEAKVEQRELSGRLAISRGAIRSIDGSRSFDTRIAAMGFGRTLCFGTQVNFTPGHVEFADFYEATDAAGKRYAVMIPEVCGNVSVLAERAERLEAAARPSGPLAGTLPDSPAPTVGRGGTARRFGAPVSGAGTTTLPGGDGGVWVPPDTPGPGGDGDGPCPPGDDGPHQVPEPATWAIVLTALAAMAVGRREPAPRHSARLDD